MMTGQYDGQGGAQQAIIGSREVEGCSETGVGDAIAVTAGMRSIVPWRRRRRR